MMNAAVRLILCAWLTLMASAALAQSNFTTPGGAVVDGKVEMCLNASSQAVPCSDASALAFPINGNVGGYDAAVSVIPTIQAAAYASGNAVGALQSVAVFRSTATPSGIFNNVFLAWKGTETTPLTFFVFDANPSGSTCTDKVAFSLAAADVSKLILPPFTLTAAAPSVGTTTTSANSTFTPLSVKNKDGSPTVNLYVCAVSGGAFTPAVGDLIYKISVAQD